MQIRCALDADIPEIQVMWREYWDAQGLSGEFQGFAQECAGLPGVYAAPCGRLLLATLEGQAAGTLALRPLERAQPSEQAACEAKRFYVRPEFRKQGVGRALLVRLIDEARAAGYRAMFADTQASMTAALALYREAGFAEVGPYSDDPTPCAVFLRLEF